MMGKSLIFSTLDDIMESFNSIDDWYDTKLRYCSNRKDWKPFEDGYLFTLDIGPENEADVRIVERKIMVVVKHKDKVIHSLYLLPPRDADLDAVEAEIHKGVLFVTISRKQVDSKIIAVKKM